MPTKQKNSNSSISQKNLNMGTVALSRRECEVLDQLSRGVCNQDLANSLEVTISTVEKHLTNIYKKLRVSSRIEAVLWWVEKGGVFRN